MIQILKHFLYAKWRWRALRTKEALEHYQNKRIVSMIDFAAKHSSFYRKHWQHHDLKEWQDLPMVTKTLMMNHFDDFNAVGIKQEDALNIALQAEQNRNFRPMLNGYTVGLSSGTSGQRGLFLVSNAERDMWTGLVLARALPSLKVKGERIAFFLRSNSNLYESIGQGKWLQFRYFDLIEDVENTVKNLNQYQPTIVVAPPSMLEVLAQKKETGYLEIQPQRLLSVAEVLEPQDKVRLEQIFKVNVYQIYQATEGLLAITCRYGALHIQEDLVKVQFETLEGDYVTPIITDLWRKTQPIIRYRLGDVLRLETQPCACGQPWAVIKQIEGREGDVLEFSNNKRLFPDVLRETVLQSLEVKDYVVIQNSIDDLHIYLEVANDFESVANQVRARLIELFDDTDIRLSTLEFIQGLSARETNLKRRRVMRKQDS